MRSSRRRLAGLLAAGAVTAASMIVAATPAGAVVGCADPGDFDHSIPAPAGTPAAAPMLGSAVLWATIGADRKTYYDGIDVLDRSLAVSTLGCLGGAAVGVPAVALYDDRATVLVLAPTGRIYQKVVTSSSPTGDPWTPVPGAPAGGGSPVATVGPDGTLHLLVRGADNRLRHAVRPAGGGWSAWEDLGGGLTGEPAVGARSGGGLVVVVRAPNGTLYQKLGTTGAWGGWTRLAGTTSASPTIATGFAAGRLDLFVAGSTGGLYQASYGTGSQPGPFRRIDGTLPARAGLAAAGANGVMVVFATGTDPVTGVTLSLYDRYAPGTGWEGFGYTPYTCEQCLPTATAGSAAGTRVVRTVLR